MSIKEKYTVIAIGCIVVLAIFCLSVDIFNGTKNKTDTQMKRELSFDNKGGEDNESSSGHDSILERKKVLIEKLRNIASSRSEEQEESLSFERALSKRLEERNGYPPTEDDLKNELNRIKEIEERTDAHMFSMAAVGFESIMMDEKANVEWEKEVKSFMENQISSELKLVANIQEIECTERICSMDFNHKNTEDRDEFIQEVSIYLGTSVNGAQIFTEKAGDKTGKIETIMYVTQRGDPLIMTDIREAIYNEIKLKKAMSESI